jgi:hypothetical protein
MKIVAMMVLAALLGIPQDSMTVPQVKHEKHTTETTTDYVTRTCPDGYEGHFVDVDPGFNGKYEGILFSNGSPAEPQGPLGYTICFKKEFMDQVRKNPDLLTPRPIIHGF